MGQLAAERIRALVPPDPAREFANTLLEMADSLAEAKAGRVEARQASERTSST
jgi:hypothetical protein